MTAALDPERIPVVIVAGGQGMRLREETERVPKPMVRIGEQPILWHIMKHYRSFGYRRFIICLGYKGWVIKEFFLSYREAVGDFRVQVGPDRQRRLEFLNDAGTEDWEITLAETGMQTGTAGRLRAVRDYIDTPHFMFTYGDGLGTVDLDGLLAQHLAGDSLVTVTGVRPSARYGVLRTQGRQVTGFAEKPEGVEAFINGGFMVMDARVFEHLTDEPLAFVEDTLLPALAHLGAVSVFPHPGFWMAMDTYRDFDALNRMWRSGDPPWKCW